MPPARPHRRLPLLASLAWVARVALGDEVVTWACDLAAMSGAAVPSGRAAFAMTLQADTGPLDSKLWLFGGLTDASTASSELWSYSLLNSGWEQKLASGPAAVHGTRMAAVGRKLYVFGGAPALDGRMWIFDTLAQTWSSVATGFAGRAYHTMTRVDTTLFIVGGAATAALPQLLTYDITLGAMSQPTTSGAAPSARTEHSVVAYASRLYLLGGIALSDSSLDSAVYELDACVGCPANAWRTVPTTGSRPLARRGHSATVIGYIMFVFGGVDITGAYQDSVYALDLRSFRWSTPHALGTPPVARWSHAAVLVNEQVRMLGGVESPPAGGGAQTFSNALFSLSRRCQGAVRLSASEGSFSMLNSQAGATACSWELAPSGAHREVEVQFTYFSLQSGHALQVSDGHVARAPLAGSSLPARLTSGSGGLTFNFSSATGTGDGYGFEATYRSLCSAGAGYAAAISSCLLCPNGTFSRAAGDTCAACDDRNYADAEGSIECTACPDYSRAAGAGATGLLQCRCLAGFYRRNGSSPCAACPAGAVCPGGTLGPWQSAAGWCRHALRADYYKCCAGDCPLGVDACPADDSAVAALGTAVCPTVSIATLSLVAFLVSLGLVIAAAVLCWCVGFTVGVRKGNSLAMRDVMSKLGLSKEEAEAEETEDEIDEEVATTVNNLISVSGLALEIEPVKVPTTRKKGHSFKLTKIRKKGHNSLGENGRASAYSDPHPAVGANARPAAPSSAWNDPPPACRASCSSQPSQPSSSGGRPWSGSNQRRTAPAPPEDDDDY